MRIWILSLLSTVVLALPAAALPGISLSEPLAATGADECSLLVQIKYPWLVCTTREDGSKRIANTTVAANASWESERRIPLGFEFVEGDGGWLPITR